MAVFKWIRSVSFIFCVSLSLVFTCSSYAKLCGNPLDCWQSCVMRQNTSKTQNLSAVDSGISYIPNCSKDILYWRGTAKPMLLPDGEYFCADMNLTLRLKTEDSYSALHTSDAVILHHTGKWTIEELVRHRPNGQVWIYMCWESPRHSRHGPVPNLFNWTMTYRPNSDFPIPYGSYKEYDPVTRERNLLKNKEINWAENKTKLAAWVVSNCYTGSLGWPRTQFVKDLQKKMTIDTFGLCGDQSCRGNECIDELGSYKFYLAFENSCCTDYITEKVWDNSFLHNVVPIVYGPNKRNYEKLAPPNSFIHMSDFPNMTSLANYIKLIDRNDSMYNNFFRWKSLGYIDRIGEEESLTKENLCAMTKKLCSVPLKHVTADMKKTWFDTCKDPPPFPTSD